MADLGLYALRLSLLLCTVGTAAGIYAGVTRRDDWTRVSERAVLLVCAATSLAMVALFWALASNDFSLSYVAAHEVAHLAEMNHSPAFWQAVERIHGPYKAQRAWLRQNGAALHAYRFD